MTIDSEYAELIREKALVLRDRDGKVTIGGLVEALMRDKRITENATPRQLDVIRLGVQARVREFFGLPEEDEDPLELQRDLLAHRLAHLKRFGEDPEATYLQWCRERTLDPDADESMEAYAAHCQKKGEK